MLFSPIFLISLFYDDRAKQSNSKKQNVFVRHLRMMYIINDWNRAAPRSNGASIWSNKEEKVSTFG